ncbi:glycine cleavage t-protein (aminomethyl transferase) domain-containing protein [Cystoisospora suis]|uniref:Glycine cleavage t-protein (Aminomethyl transferase) domain-containing protein n=1 Tax=Cystoisospora suis TaxID=483139 RepID=A0A2C6LC07_9APIC|nr:glycine cleavage t-protein (aminomethyl transferase) domain-containing protein [Cystoisospora suis]
MVLPTTPTPRVRFFSSSLSPSFSLHWKMRGGSLSSFPFQLPSGPLTDEAAHTPAAMTALRWSSSSSLLSRFYGRHLSSPSSPTSIRIRSLIHQTRSSESLLYKNSFFSHISSSSCSPLSFLPFLSSSSSSHSSHSSSLSFFCTSSSSLLSSRRRCPSSSSSFSSPSSVSPVETRIHSRFSQSCRARSLHSSFLCVNERRTDGGCSIHHKKISLSPSRSQKTRVCTSFFRRHHIASSLPQQLSRDFSTSGYFHTSQGAGGVYTPHHRDEKDTSLSTPSPASSEERRNSLSHLQEISSLETKAKEKNLDQGSSLSSSFTSSPLPSLSRQQPQQAMGPGGSVGIRRSPLYELHASLGAKFGRFQGMLLPITYEGEGVMKSHLHTRSYASLFDLSFRHQYRVTGEHAAVFLERLVVGDIQSLLESESRFTLLTDEDGHILDDLIVSVQHPKSLLITGNALNASRVLSLLLSHAEEAQAKGEDVAVESLEDYTLIGVQGPYAMAVMGTVIDQSQINLVKMPFMCSRQCRVDGIEEGKLMSLTRCGFSGEDGFEISLPSKNAASFASRLLEQQQQSPSSPSSCLRPAGMGARDTLRQEAALCQYGLDIDDQTTPVEASLSWAVGRRRKQEGQHFPGKERILAQLRHQQEFLHLLQLRRRDSSLSETPIEGERNEKEEEEKERLRMEMKGLQVQLDAAADRAGIPEEFRLRKKRVGFIISDATTTPAKSKAGEKILTWGRREDQEREETDRQSKGEDTHFYEKVGRVTSGCFAPSLQRCIGMGYLQLPYAQAKTPLLLGSSSSSNSTQQGRKKKDIQVVKMPFVPAAYYRVPLSF